MAHRNFIESLRGTGDPEDRFFAHVVEDRLKQRGKDISVTVSRKEQTGDTVRFTDDQKKELEKRGRTAYISLSGETLAELEEQTGTKIYLAGSKVQQAKTLPALQGVEVAINLDNPIPVKTFGRPFDTQVSILQEANTEIDGVTDTYPTTPADAVAIALEVNGLTSKNILFSRWTRVGMAGSLIVGFLNPGVSVDVSDDFQPSGSNSVGLLSLAVPQAALGS